MKKIATTAGVLLVTAGSALANTGQSYTQDHFKSVIEQKPYTVEVCSDVRVPVYGQVGNGASASDVLGGMILGGILGKGITNKDDGAAAGAVLGGIIAADKKHNKQGVTGYRTERQCKYETRYNETTREVYSHSTVTFWHEGVKRTLRFNK